MQPQRITTPKGLTRGQRRDAAAQWQRQANARRSQCTTNVTHLRRPLSRTVSSWVFWSVIVTASLAATLLTYELARVLPLIRQLLP